MIPYIEATHFSLGPLTIQVWGMFVAAAFLIGTFVAARRAKRLKLESDHVWNMAFWMFLAAMIGSRAWHVIAYNPSYYLVHPLEALDPRTPGYAIFGGFMGAVVVFWYYTRKHALRWMEYADAMIWGVPLACGVGRIGCFLIHDHPGTLTHAITGVRYPDGEVRHDLGLYLSLVGFAGAIAFLILDKKPRPKGFWIGSFMLIEALSRFWLDGLRIGDARYAGLTPTQWLAIPLFWTAFYFLAIYGQKKDV